jgi:hypothetical protein
VRGVTAVAGCDREGRHGKKIGIVAAVKQSRTEITLNCPPRSNRMLSSCVRHPWHQASGIRGLGSRYVPLVCGVPVIGQVGGRKQFFELIEKGDSERTAGGIVGMFHVPPSRFTRRLGFAPTLVPRFASGMANFLAKRETPIAAIVSLIRGRLRAAMLALSDNRCTGRPTDSRAFTNLENKFVTWSISTGASSS